MKKNKKNVFLSIFDDGCFLTKGMSPTGEGFELAHHRNNHGGVGSVFIPLSPFKINLRTADHPTDPGTLSQDTMDSIGEMLYLLSKELKLDYDYVVGIPNAGSFIADAFAKAALDIDGRVITILRMIKDGPLITSVHHGMKVLVLDDLITGAVSKIKPVQRLFGEKLKVVAVLVLIDRQERGIRKLKEVTTVDCHAVMKMMDLLDFYLEKKRIDEATHMEIFKYLRGRIC